MADNILYLNISLVSWKCLLEVWLFDKGGMDDKIAMIAMCRRMFRKNVPTSNAQQSFIASLNLCSRFVAHIPYTVETMRSGGDWPRVTTSNQLCS